METDDRLNKVFRIAQLLEKQVKNESLTAEEQAEVERWLAAREGNKRVFERISDEKQLAFALLELKDTDTERELKKIRPKLQRNVESKKVMGYWAVAAAILGLFLSIGFGIYWYQAHWEKPMELAEGAGDDALPGGNRATLTLADGRTIALNETQTGIVVGDAISYTDGTAVLDGGDGRNLVPAEPVLLQLTTPRGGTYQLALPDGTHVWLNAGSTLRYPSKFTGGERVVELEGEAYFDVKSKLAESRKIPFRVKTSGQIIEVLGTQFNVSAYIGETVTKTTLVAGRVQVTASQVTQYQAMVLLPGQQSVLQNQSLMVNEVDVQPFIAWKEGYFHFKSTPFAEVLTQMSRWYNIELVYEGNIPSQTFTGKMSRNVSLQNVLKLFKGSGIRFNFADQKLYIE